MKKILAIISAVFAFLFYGLSKRYDKIKDDKAKADGKIEELEFIKKKEKESKDAKDNINNSSESVDELLDKQGSLRD